MTDPKSKKDRPANKTMPETPVSKRDVEKALSDRDEKNEKSKARGAKAASPYMIPEKHAWASLWKVWAGVSVVGLLMAVASFFMADPDGKKRFAFAYLTAFEWGLTIVLGGLFFVLLQHLTSAGWSVVVRRGAEQVMAALPLFLVLFVPVVIFKTDLYPWLDPHIAHEPAIAAKHGFLNFPFWMVRAFIYFAVWLYFGLKLFSLSREQDASGDHSLTNRMRAMSPVGMLLFGFTSTFAGVDWVMSLDPEWYSTMFGVYMFAGSVISIMAFLVALYTYMTRAKLLAHEVTPEHFHDLGKLMFAFTVFWAYIGFAQYFLIWYANIPEETLFFRHRQENGWGTVSILLVLGHFFFPFFLMLSRHSKRWAGPRLVGALWILVMHFVDMYWLIMPNTDHHFAFLPIMDIGCLMFVGGALFAMVFRGLAAAPIVPVKDPRLGRSLEFENA